MSPFGSKADVARHCHPIPGVFSDAGSHNGARAFHRRHRARRAELSIPLICWLKGASEINASGAWAILASRVIFDLNQSLSAEKVTGSALLAIAGRSPTRVQLVSTYGEYRAGRAGTRPARL